jgi:hypothetical protein
MLKQTIIISLIIAIIVIVYTNYVENYLNTNINSTEHLTVFSEQLLGRIGNVYNNDIITSNSINCTNDISVGGNVNVTGNISANNITATQITSGNLVTSTITSPLITTGNMSTTNINTPLINANNAVVSGTLTVLGKVIIPNSIFGAYFISQNSASFPIFGSLVITNNNTYVNFDDKTAIWIVLPGYKLTITRKRDNITIYGYIDNVNGTKPMTVSTQNMNIPVTSTGNPNAYRDIQTATSQNNLVDVTNIKKKAHDDALDVPTIKIDLYYGSTLLSVLPEG